MVRAKKKLGQHFLHDKNIAEKIVKSINPDDNIPIVEIGPGKGALTDFLIKHSDNFLLIEVDKESVDFLLDKYKDYELNIIQDDFLKIDIKTICNSNPIKLLGNLPYNISSQIFFKIIENRIFIPEVVCMIQKEVAIRIAAKPNSKTYGILSVLLQLFYDIEYLFTVGEKVFTPPPKVKSGVIRLKRHTTKIEGVEEKKLFQIVKQSFNQRRKTLRKSLKSLVSPDLTNKHSDLFNKRPEQLNCSEFINLTKIIFD